MGQQHNKQFKLDVIQYHKEHHDLSEVEYPQISAPAPLPAWNLNTGLIPMTFPLGVSATIPPTSKKKLPVLKGNSVNPASVSQSGQQNIHEKNGH